MSDEGPARRSAFQFGLKGLLGCLLLLSLGSAMTIPALLGARKLSLKSDCRGDLGFLGSSITLYVSRYGNDQGYPMTVCLNGSGAPVPAGPNGAFWSWLYRVPNAAQAVSPRPGEDGIYECPVFGGRGHARVTTLEYTGPQLGATWPAGSGPNSGQPVFSGGRLSEAVRGDAMIAGDVIGPPDTPNHGGLPGAPNDDWNVLMFDGHVESVFPGSLKHTLYAIMTTGGRTP